MEQREHMKNQNHGHRQKRVLEKELNRDTKHCAAQKQRVA
jgi:hypothetical protein